MAAAQRAHTRATAESIRAEKALKAADAEVRTAEAVDVLEQIDSLLAATLEVDDYVDIDSLKQKVQHPPFARDDLKTPVKKPPMAEPPPEPQFVPRPAPTGVSKLFKGQKYAEEHARAESAWAKEHEKWTHYVQQELPEHRARVLEEYAEAETRRAEQLSKALAEYKAQCAERERVVAEANQKLEIFKEALAHGDDEAIAEYIGIVLSNSAYPDAFEVGYEWEFDSELKELEIVVIVPPPSDMPNIKAYKYVAAADETRATTCSQKEQRDRYNGAVAAVAIRTFHEVFESDRDGRIQTVSLTVSTETANPATGLNESFPFIAAAADREEFLKFDLRNVDPAQTLAHTRSQVSKNAFGLKPISTARGVR